MALTRPSISKMVAIIVGMGASDGRYGWSYNTELVSAHYGYEKAYLLTGRVLLLNASVVSCLSGFCGFWPILG